jgi:hypothetical protein
MCLIKVKKYKQTNLMANAFCVFWRGGIYVVGVDHKVLSSFLVPISSMKKEKLRDHWVVHFISLEREPDSNHLLTYDTISTDVEMIQTTLISVLFFLLFFGFFVVADLAFLNYNLLKLAYACRN